MNAAIYARVSSDKQDVDLPIAAQLEASRESAQRNGHSAVREFVGEAQADNAAEDSLVSWPP